MSGKPSPPPLGRAIGSWGRHAPSGLASDAFYTPDAGSQRQSVARQPGHSLRAGNHAFPQQPQRWNDRVPRARLSQYGALSASRCGAGADGVEAGVDVAFIDDILSYCGLMQNRLVEVSRPRHPGYLSGRANASEAVLRVSHCFIESLSGCYCPAVIVQVSKSSACA